MVQPAANSNVPPIPSFLTQLVTALMQKGLTALATALTGYGAIKANQIDGLISIGVSIGLWTLSFAWTYFHEEHIQVTKRGLLNADPPVPPVPVAAGAAVPTVVTNSGKAA